MKVVNVHEAKTQLSKYLSEVAKGGELVIGRYGEPIAKLVPYTGEKARYRFGMLRGKLHLAGDFDEVEKVGGTEL